MPPSYRTSKRGYNLAEIIISMAIVSMLLTSIHHVLRSATHYLTRTTLITDLQQSCVLGCSRIVTEMMESNVASIRPDVVYPGQYVSFGTPRNTTGENTFDLVTGNLQWHGIVGFYIADRNGETALYRKEEPIAPMPDPPNVSIGYTDVIWKARAVPARLIGTRIYALDVENDSSTVNLAIGTMNREKTYRIIVHTKFLPRN